MKFNSVKILWWFLATRESAPYLTPHSTLRQNSTARFEGSTAFLGDVGALVRPHMNNSLPFKGTIQKTTETTTGLALKQ